MIINEQDVKTALLLLDNGVKHGEAWLKGPAITLRGLWAQYATLKSTKEAQHEEASCNSSDGDERGGDSNASPADHRQ